MQFTVEVRRATKKQSKLGLILGLRNRDVHTDVKTHSGKKWIILMAKWALQLYSKRRQESEMRMRKGNKYINCLLSLANVRIRDAYTTLKDVGVHAQLH